jgi:hypothetical protein
MSFLYEVVLLPALVRRSFPSIRKMQRRSKSPTTPPDDATVHASSVTGAYTKLKPIGRGQNTRLWLVRHTVRGGETLVLKEITGSL